jgi:hypothetical protein
MAVLTEEWLGVTTLMDRGWYVFSPAEKAMVIAADTCIYTNNSFTVETIPAELKQDWNPPK